MPEFRFDVEPAKEVLVQGNTAAGLENTGQPPESDTLAPSKEPETMQDSTLYMLLGIVNGAIVLIIGIVVGIIVWRRKKAAMPAIDKVPAPKENTTTTDADLSAEPKPGMLAKLTGFFKKKPKEDKK